MKSVVGFIDGYNLYHGLEEKPDFHRYKWINLKELCRSILPKDSCLKEVLYFTSLTKKSVDKRIRQKEFIAIQEHFGVKVIYGYFDRHRITCSCGKVFKYFKERRTDTALTSALLKYAFTVKPDIALVISGDSDLIPAAQCIEKCCSSKIILATLPNRTSKELKRYATEHVNLLEDHFKKSELPPKITISGKIYLRPSSWT